MADQTNSGLVILTAKDLLAKHAEMIQLRYGYGLKYAEIMKLTGCSERGLTKVLAKYKPKITGRDLYVTISSRANEPGDLFLHDAKDLKYYN